MDTLSSYKVLTITHKSTQLKNIGNFVLPDLDSEYSLQQKLESIKHGLGLGELLYLATCNRVLFFFVTEQELNHQFLEKFQKVVYPDLNPSSCFEGSICTYSGRLAIQHLLEVASSVDSLVVGEREILRQLREAYERCTKIGATGDSIRMAMQLAVETAKKVYSTTRIGQKSVSVVSLAIRQLLSKKPATNARILIVGAGQTNTLVGKFLLKSGFENCTVFNRSIDNAKELATMLNGDAFALDTIENYDKGFDVLIACTGSTQAVITKALYERLLQGETDKKIIIDLSIPNNIAADVPTNFDVNHIEIDGLKDLVSENLAFREKEVACVQIIIEERLKEFNIIYKGRQVELALSHVPTQIKAIRQHAITSVFKNEFLSLDDNAQELVDRMMAYMEKRCIAIPIQAAKEHFLK